MSPLSMSVTATNHTEVLMMSRITRNNLSVLAWGGAVFCALWLLVSAQAAVDHSRQSHTDTPIRTPVVENSH
jgi:hypothetical protein